MIYTVIKMVIAADPGWAIGAATGDGTTVDEELLTDPKGDPWIPATSIGGSLRAHLAAHGADHTLMGSRSSSDQLTASRLWLLGARVTAKGEDRPPGTEVVASTAIDQRRRAALPKSLRHARIVGEPTSIELYGMVEGGLSPEERKLLAGWRPAVGGNRTTGGGRAQLESLAYRDYDLDRDEDLRTWLTNTGLARFTGLTEERVAPQEDDVVIEVTFRIVDGLHIGTGSRSGKTALIRTRDQTPVLPGKTWKGLFRARSGYILRTLFGDEAACTSQVGCGQCALCDLFGSVGSRGRLAFGDSLVTGAVNTSHTHVGIDRVTGGARTQLLFTQQVVREGELTLRIRSLAPVADWQRNLLLHVVRDLDDGLIGVGGGAQRGHGTLRLITPLEAPQAVARP